MQAKGWQGASIRLHWRRSEKGYELREHYDLRDAIPWPPERGEPPFICEIGYRPGPRFRGLKEFEVSTRDCGNIVKDLLNMTDGDDAIVAFTNRWGQLDDGVNSKKAFTVFRNEVQHVYESGSKLSELMRMMEGQTFGTAHIRCVRGANGKHDLVWHLDSLRGLCWLAILEDVGGIDGSILVQCAGCGEWFQKRGLKGPAPEHCSSACRQRLYRLRKADRG